MQSPCKLNFDLLTLKVVSESRVTWATSVPILVFLGLSVLRPDVCVRQTSDVHHRLMPPTLGAGHNNAFDIFQDTSKYEYYQCDRKCILKLLLQQFLKVLL